MLHDPLDPRGSNNRAEIGGSPMLDGPSDRPLAFVTGAAQGIGRGICLALAKDGHDIVGFDRAPQASRRGAELVRALNRLGAKALYVSGDATQRAEVEGALALAKAHFGGRDVRVAVATVGGNPDKFPRQVFTRTCCVCWSVWGVWGGCECGYVVCGVWLCVQEGGMNVDMWV